MILVVDLSERVYGKEQLQNTAAFDVIGFLLAGSALMTTMGAGLSTRLVIDAVTEHKRLIADDKRCIEGCDAVTPLMKRGLRPRVKG